MSQLVGHGGVNIDVSDASGAAPPWIAVGANIGHAFPQPTAAKTMELLTDTWLPDPGKEVRRLLLHALPSYLASRGFGWHATPFIYLQPPISSSRGALMVVCHFATPAIGDEADLRLSGSIRKENAPEP